MSEEILVDKEMVPIPINEIHNNHLFKALVQPDEARTLIIKAMEAVLEIMLHRKLTLMPDHRAVWFYLFGVIEKEQHISLHERPGESFPSAEFGESCKQFSKEEVVRTVQDNLLCSYENRNSQNKEYVSSARLVFELISESGQVKFFTLVGAPSGLKTWENLALFLGALYFLELITLKDSQVQEILKRADKAVAGQPDFLPPNMTIAQYTENLFAIIDKEEDPRTRICKNPSDSALPMRRKKKGNSPWELAFFN